LLALVCVNRNVLERRGRAKGIGRDPGHIWHVERHVAQHRILEPVGKDGILLRQWFPRRIALEDLVGEAE